MHINFKSPYQFNSDLYLYIRNLENQSLNFCLHIFNSQRLKKLVLKIGIKASGLQNHLKSTTRTKTYNQDFGISCPGIWIRLITKLYFVLLNNSDKNLNVFVKERAHFCPLQFIFLQKRVYQGLTTPYLRKSLLTEAPYPHNDWFTSLYQEKGLYIFVL